MWVLGAVVFVALLAVVVAVSLRVLIKDTAISKYSKYTISKFEPDNTAPKLTEMVEYHKANEKIRYVIGE